MLRRLMLVPALGALVLACEPPEEGPLMDPGEDCMHCHTTPAKSADPDAPPWTVAGTLYRDPHAKAEQGLEGAEVVITDKNKRSVTLRTTGSGNFYSAEAFAFPIEIEVRKNGKTAKMNSSPPVGACNACHAAEPKNDAPGRVFLPQ